MLIAKLKRSIIYPSATKIFPSESTATSVGLQKWELSLPGKNCLPSVNEGRFSPGANLKTCKKYNKKLLSNYRVINILQEIRQQWFQFLKQYSTNWKRESEIACNMTRHSLKSCYLIACEYSRLSALRPLVAFGSERGEAAEFVG